MNRISDSPLLRLWGWPIVMGGLTASGLLAALVSDTWGDAWSWVALGIPVATMARLGLRRRPEGAPAPRAATASTARAR